LISCNSGINNSTLDAILKIIRACDFACRDLRKGALNQREPYTRQVNCLSAGQVADFYQALFPEYRKQGIDRSWMMRIAMVGCGAIGAAVLKALSGRAQVRVTTVVVRDSGVERAIIALREAASDAAISATVPLDDTDLVLEVAGHSAVESHVLPALLSGIPAIIVSVGSLSGSDLAARLEAAAQSGNTQIELISGAIGAIDALNAASIGGLTEVHYTGRKPPLAWKGSPAELACDLSRLTEKKVIFSGTARDAASMYPKNANVAAAISLAGIGLDRTTVELIADPRTTENFHHLHAVGMFGKLDLTMQNNALADNPKTSALTVFSAVRAVLRRVEPIVI
jgi:aspartate dehydrogenase